MENKFIDIIMFAMSSFSDWAEGVQNRNYHVLNTLQKDKRVRKILVVDFLPFTFKKAIKVYIKDIILNKHGGNIIYGDLTSECHQHTSKIYNYSSIDSIFNEKIIIREIKKIIKILEMQNIVLWSYNPLFVKYFRNFSEKLTVFDTVDNWINHSSYQQYKKRLENNYKIISDNTDIIFTVADNLKNFYHKFGRKQDIYFFQNGINTNYFTEENINYKSEVEFFTKNNISSKKVVGYIGVMQKDRFDINLISYCAKKHPDKNFVLAGPIWKEMKNEILMKTKEFNNIYFPGMIPRDKWISCCNYFDVAINPHLKSEFIKYTSPTKIFEYLACGKPVVSTNVSGVDDLKNLIYIADDYESFSQAIIKSINEDSTEKRNLRIKYAKDNFSWDKRVGEMLNIIFRKLN